MDVCLLGTGGMMPLPGRWLTSCWVEHNGKALLIDCGEGTQIALAQTVHSLSHLEGLLITHCHADHIAGLPGLLLTLGNCSKTTPLTIVGTREVKLILEHLLVLCPRLPYELKFLEAPAKEPIQTQLAGFHITTVPLDHWVPCLGYVAEVQRKPVFNPQKAKALDVPQKLWSVLHGGQAVSWEGKTVLPEQVLDGERRPYRLAYCTDTRPTPFMKLIQGSQLFICEGMYGDNAQLENAIEKHHMIFSEAACIAAENEVEELWLTHFSPAMPNPEDFLSVAAQIFPNTVIGRDGMSKQIR